VGHIPRRFLCRNAKATSLIIIGREKTAAKDHNGIVTVKRSGFGVSLSANASAHATTTNPCQFR